MHIYLPCCLSIALLYYISSFPTLIQLLEDSETDLLKAEDFENELFSKLKLSLSIDGISTLFASCTVKGGESSSQFRWFTIAKIEL